MLEIRTNRNVRAAKLAVSLSIGLCVLALCLFSASVQQASAAEQEQMVTSHAYATTLSAPLSVSTPPTGTITMPNGDLTPQMRFPIIIYAGSVGTATLPDPGTATVPPGTRIYYVPIIHVQ